MFVRCPKCRHQYEEPINEGFTEIHCVCPLCGTPFVVDTAAASAATDSTYGRQTGTQGGAADGYDTAGKDGSAHGTTDEKSRKNDGSGLPNDGQNGSLRLGSYRTSQQRWAMDIIFLLILLMVLLGYRRCQETSQPKVVDTLEGLTIDSNDHFTAAPTPQWLEGFWTGAYRGDTITLTIHANIIALTQHGKITSGAFRYTDDRLYCAFSPDTIVIYHIDERREEIKIPAPRSAERIVMRKRE